MLSLREKLSHSKFTVVISTVNFGKCNILCALPMHDLFAIAKFFVTFSANAAFELSLCYTMDYSF